MNSTTAASLPLAPTQEDGAVGNKASEVFAAEEEKVDCFATLPDFLKPDSGGVSAPPETLPGEEDSSESESADLDGARVLRNLTKEELEESLAPTDMKGRSRGYSDDGLDPVARWHLARMAPGASSDAGEALLASCEASSQIQARTFPRNELSQACERMKLLQAQVNARTPMQQAAVLELEMRCRAAYTLIGKRMRRDGFWQQDQPMAVRVRFTRPLLDRLIDENFGVSSATSAAGGAASSSAASTAAVPFLLPSVLLQLIAEYAPVDLAGIEPEEPQDSVTSWKNRCSKSVRLSAVVVAVLSISAGFLFSRIFPGWVYVRSDELMHTCREVEHFELMIMRRRLSF
jgi:hypothetical protein